MSIGRACWWRIKTDLWFWIGIYGTMTVLMANIGTY
jgi:hypothetical protein